MQSFLKEALIESEFPATHRGAAKMSDATH